MVKNRPGAIIIEGHVQGLANTRALGREGIPVFVIDKTNCIARYSKYCKKYFRCPDFTKYEFVDFLIQLAKRENLKDWVLSKLDFTEEDFKKIWDSDNKTFLDYPSLYRRISFYKKRFGALLKYIYPQKPMSFVELEVNESINDNKE